MAMKIILLTNTKNRGRSLAIGRGGLVVICLAVVSLSAGLFFSGLQYARHDSVRILQSIRNQTTSTWKQEINAQQKQLRGLKLTADKSLDAMASKLSLLQGQVMRLDALGSRLASMAHIDDLKFGVDNPPGMGGPAPAVQQTMNVPDFLGTLDQLAAEIQDRGEKLSAIETMLINRKLQEQTLPTGMPARSGWISSLYGYRSDPITGKREFHEGIDFAGKPGTPITAVAAGIVTWSGPRYGYGNLVEINHGGGIITRYAHNSKNLVKVGDKVEKGEVIAVMGSTGRSTGTHVHFEVLKNGKPVNPKTFIAFK